MRRSASLGFSLNGLTEGDEWARALPRPTNDMLSKTFPVFCVPAYVPGRKRQWHAVQVHQRCTGEAESKSRKPAKSFRENSLRASA